MDQHVDAFTAREQVWLWVIAIFGFVVVNGAFVYAALDQPEMIAAAVRNPVAAAFMLETVVLLGLLSYVLRRWRLSRLHWGWFVALSLLGSIAFALPVALLWQRSRERRA